MKQRWIQSVLLSAALLWGVPMTVAQGAEAFPATSQLGGQSLVMNGKGTRFRAVFSVYELALYLPQKTSDPKQVLSMPGPKQARFVALRDIPADQFGLSLVSGMRQNVDPAHEVEVLTYMNDVIQVFSTAPTIKSGQTFRVDYVPGQGTRFFLNGQQKGPTVASPRFAAAVFSIWMGPRPVDDRLKEALLGVQASSQPDVHLN